MCSHWVIDVDVRLVRFTDVVLYVRTLQMFIRFTDSSDYRFIQMFRLFRNSEQNITRDPLDFRTWFIHP